MNKRISQLGWIFLGALLVIGAAQPLFYIKAINGTGTGNTLSNLTVKGWVSGIGAWTNSSTLDLTGGGTALRLNGSFQFTSQNGNLIDSQAVARVTITAKQSMSLNDTSGAAAITIGKDGGLGISLAPVGGYGLSVTGGEIDTNTVTGMWAIYTNGQWLVMQTNSLGAYVPAYVSTNITPATASGQSLSAIRIGGNGWKTAATAASQPTFWDIVELPVQGSANPSHILAFTGNVNGTLSSPFRINSLGGGSIEIGTTAGAFGAWLNNNGIFTGYASNNGAPFMTVNGGNNFVGIKTNNPADLLEIGKAASSFGLTMQNDNAISFRDFAGAQRSALWWKADDTLQFRNNANGSGGDITFFNGSLETARFNTNNRVGIGTTTPAALLDVNGTTSHRGVVTNIVGFASLTNATAAPNSITVGASPFNYTNTAGVNIQLFLDANGATTAVSYNGTAIFSSLAAGDHTIILKPASRITVTYSLATPIMQWTEL